MNRATTFAFILSVTEEGVQSYGHFMNHGRIPAAPGVPCHMHDSGQGEDFSPSSFGNSSTKESGTDRTAANSRTRAGWRSLQLSQQCQPPLLVTTHPKIASVFAVNQVGLHDSISIVSQRQITFGDREVVIFYMVSWQGYEPT